MMRKVSFINPTTITLVWCILFFAHASFAQTLSFSNAVQYGSQENNLSILVSTDFNGHYDMENIGKATWNDLTEEFHLATDKKFVKSGEADLSSWTTPGKPIYIAFRYLGQESAKPTQRSWIISNVSVNDGQTDNRIPTQKFSIIDVLENKEGTTWLKSDIALRFRSNLSKIKSESWAIVRIVDGKVN
ncbi:DUF5017 domain-containing protein [Sphingobacterium chuzhouense]|uniref:DUF5017 domain-containing protein n=1 Tax=Sphingobacterium chuzhouense TaxID=1742264 RepID=A0ABR7XUS9_9SPHI|nr:DUF5017 domain-containing protein [Sphingobacterium chuzhouense]MBD1422812.1 DUF5017 domain-containing protein [Sphingobacterium chuzhouense]